MIVTEEHRQATGEHPDAEALIKEARQRQRRRWLIIGATLLLVATGSGLALSGSDGGRAKEPPPAGSSSVPARPFASPFAVRQFSALVKKGLRQSYVATYRYLGAREAPYTFVYVHAGAPQQYPPFLYKVTAKGLTYELFSGISSPVVQCVAHGSDGRWTCFGFDGCGNGCVIQVLSYNIAPDYFAWFDPPLHSSTITTREVGGFRYTCLSYRTAVRSVARWFDGVRPTWCITAQGIVGFIVGFPKVWHRVQLVSLSYGVPRGAFTLPAALGAPGGFLSDTYPQFSPPGYAAL